MRRSILALTAAFSAALLAMIGESASLGDPYATATGMVCLGLMWVPAILEARGYLQAPWPMVLGCGLALSLHTLGLVTGWYYTSFWWDKLTHLSSGIMIGTFFAIAFMAIDRYSRTVRIPPRWYPFFIMVSVLTMEAFWEIIEFALDGITGTMMQHSLADTVNDILTNAASGIMAGLGVVLYLRGGSVDTLLTGLRADRIIGWFRKRYGKAARLKG